MAQQLFYGSLYGTPLGTDSNSVVRVSGSLAGTTLTVSSSVAGFLGQEAVRPGMVISASGYSSTVVTASGASITLSDAGSITGELFRIMPQDGNYYVSSASFSDPNQTYNINDITGSNDPEYITGSRLFGVQAKAEIKVGKYHQFEITDVLYRDTASQEVGFYMAWNESGSEADTGDNIGANLQYMTIMGLTDRFEFGTIFSRRVGNFSNLEVGADQAAYQIAIEQIDKFTTPTGSFTGSFHGEVTGSFTGSIVATGSLTGSFTGSIDATGSLTGSFSGSGIIESSDTASSADNFTVRENLTVLGDANIAGTLVADVIHTRFETASILYSSGSTKFGDTDDDTHNFTGSVIISGSEIVTGSINVTERVTAEDFVGIFRGALSSSQQIADEISGSFTLVSESFSLSQTNLSSSISTDRTSLSSSISLDRTSLSSSISTDRTLLSASFSTSQTNLSSSISTDRTSLSSSASTAREAISSSAAIALTDISASFSNRVEDVVSGVVSVDSASRAERAGAIDDLVQDVDITGDLSIDGTGTNTDPSITVENGIIMFSNIPSFISDAAAASGGIPIGGLYRAGSFLVIRTV